MNSLIGYAGGKARQAGWISGYINKINHETYVEPFSGVASVFFAKEKSQIEVLNDQNKIIYYIFKSLRDYPTEFVEFCSLIEYSEQARKGAINILFKQDNSKMEVWKLGAWALFLIASSFSGNFLASTFGVGYTGKSSAKKWLEKHEHLKFFIDRAKEAIIFNRNAIEIINKYDRDGVVMYCDPPYHNSKYNYNCEFDHEVLAKTLHNIKSAKILLSHYYVEPYISMYKDWYVDTKDSSQSCRGNSVTSDRTGLAVVEGLWMNFKPNKDEN